MKSFATTIRRNAYITLGKLDGQKQSKDIVILCYHSVADDNWRFSVGFNTLKKQIDHLLSIRKPLSMEDLDDYLHGKREISEPSFIITFDDGYQNILQTVEYFKQHAIRPTVFLLSDQEYANRKELNNSLPFLTKDETLTLKSNGWTLAVHSATHADFNNLDSISTEVEIWKAKKDLEKNFSTEMKYFSYPKGAYSNKILNMVVKSGYKLAVSMDDGFIHKKTHPLTIPRIGVDASHTFEEFKILYSPSVIRFRGFFKKTPAAQYFQS